LGGRRSSTTQFFKVGIRAILGHAVVDSFWFGAGFLGKSTGLPLVSRPGAVARRLGPCGVGTGPGIRDWRCPGPHRRRQLGGSPLIEAILFPGPTHLLLPGA
jgi:hypothetical protein